ncbi:hypothetical protein [Jutongia huaianensis]|uniref:Uncharacterized protein n=1 Tax=Jutongia huaianensis TaxID=2763668 RepID=A0ABR7N4K5_9FIRM|nr:hypothetical protein [Jutongia huaianensis]MBC8563002.1 hypothetical protein [Jutongia huaianensis]MBS4816127.1 hypothetical protein [Clostridium sp.]RHU91561.1 hypothetical protein DXC08_14125 [Clostridium sp. OM07-9AC]RHV00660.1 hypothetical protein DXB96_14035 [Clostridium sp. OM07-10AC]
MKDLKKEIETVINDLDSIVEMFYQQKVQEAYSELNTALGKIMEITEVVQNYTAQNSDKEINMDILLNALKETLSAMEERDVVLVADVLKYEVIEKLNDIAEQI